MAVADEVLHNNERYAATFDRGNQPPGPARGVLVLTCMDARVDPNAILGLEHGDAHVFRNAGGIATDDTIRSLAISQRLIGSDEVIVMQHTRCGMLDIEEEEFRRRLADETGVEPEWRIGAFDDLDENVRRSVARIRESPFVPNTDAVRGFVYDVETGRLREVA
jgi:carbonic anhydrase